MRDLSTMFGTLVILFIFFAIAAVVDGAEHYDYSVRNKLIKESKLDYRSLNGTKDSSGNNCYEMPDNLEYKSNGSTLVVFITLACDKGDTIGQFIKTDTTYDYSVSTIENVPFTFRFSRFKYKAIVNLDTMHLSVLEFLRFK